MYPQSTPTPIVDPQLLFNALRNDYAHFLKFYREHAAVLRKIELLEVQLSDIIAIPCGGCGHTFNNCPEVIKKAGGKSEQPEVLSPRSLINKLFAKVKDYLEEYNARPDNSPVSATLSADNSILFCKLFKNEAVGSSKDLKSSDNGLSVSTKSRSTASGKPNALRKISSGQHSGSGAHPSATSSPNIDPVFGSPLDISNIRPAAPHQPLPPQPALSKTQQSAFRPVVYQPTAETGTDKTIQIKGAGGRSYIIGWDGPLNQYGLPFGPGLVTHNGIKYFSVWGTCKWGSSMPFLRSRNDSTTPEKDMVYYPDGSVFVGVLGNSYGRLFFRATGTIAYPDGKKLVGNWDPDDITFASGEKEYLKNPGEFLPDFHEQH